MDGIQDQTGDIWDKRWQGSETKERLTLVAKVMFKAKERAIQKVLRQIKIKNMIEVGCGLGYTLSVFQAAGIDAVGIDVSGEAINVCKNKGLNAKLQALQEVSEKYELVSSDGLLEHFLNFQTYAKYLMNISTKYVLLIQPNHNSFFGKTAVYLSDLLRAKENVYEYNYSIGDFINTFKVAGFKLVQNIPVFLDVFRLLLFEKNLHRFPLKRDPA